MAEIRVDYQDTINKARRLENVAQEVKSTCSKNMSSISSYCNSAWKGDAADAYQKKMSQIKTRIMKRGTNLQTTAVSLENAAKRYKRIEEAAASIFSR